MTEPNTAITDNPSTSTAARIGWAILILATLYICYFSHLGAIGFVGPDEPRYAWIARDMAESGDWVTPRLYGRPWFEKPPLLYWGAALSFKLLGVSEAAARLPSAISALLATLALAWLALRLYGAETARWLLLLLPTTVGMIGFSHAAATDMPFSAMLTIAMVCAAVVLGLTRNENSPVIPRTPLLALILLGFFLGLAVLAKGPAAIILSGGAIFFWALFTKRWRDAFRLVHPTAIASFCLTALPWYILCTRRNPDFLRIFILEHNFKRFLTPEFQHIQPFWYYIPILLIALVPWTPFLFSLAVDGLHACRENRWRTSPALFLSCWMVFTVLFFTTSKSKLPGYILPGTPPLGLLMARTVAERLKRNSQGSRLVGAGSALMLLGFSFGIAAASEKIPFAIDYFPPQPLAWLLLADFSLAVVALILAFLRHSRTAVFVTILAFLLTVEAAPTGDAGSALDLGLSSRWAAQAPEGVSHEYWNTHVTTYKLKRSFVYSSNFYFHRELAEWSEDTTRRNWVLTSPSELQTMHLKGLKCPPFMAFPAVIVCEAEGAARFIPRSAEPLPYRLPRSGQPQQEK